LGGEELFEVLQTLVHGDVEGLAFEFAFLASGYNLVGSDDMGEGDGVFEGLPEVVDFYLFE
jgi:hypothetical protein